MTKATATAAPVTQQEQTPQEQATQSAFHYDVNIYPSKTEGTQKASASVNLNGAFAIRGIRIMQGTNGLFVSVPSYKAGNGEYKDYCFPCTKASKAEFDNAILTAYEQKMEQIQTNAPTQEAQQEQGQQMAGM